MKGSAVSKRVLILIGQVVYSFILILLISGIPVLFQGLKLNIGAYTAFVQEMGMKVLFFNNETFWERSPIFPQILERSGDTFTLLILALVISLAVSILFASAAVLFLKKRMNWIKRMILAAEAIPDIFIITVLQALVIFIYKQTDVLIVKVASLGDEKSYVLPLICLGIPASVYLVKILIKTIEEEEEKAYAELAKAIGTSPVRILIFHISRNAFHKIMINSKTLVWSLLASMLIIEYVFNYPGMLSFLLTYRSPEVFLMAVTILFLPFFVVYQSYFLFAPDLIKGEKG